MTQRTLSLVATSTLSCGANASNPHHLNSLGQAFSPACDTEMIVSSLHPGRCRVSALHHRFLLVLQGICDCIDKPAESWPLRVMHVSKALLLGSYGSGAANTGNSHVIHCHPCCQLPPGSAVTYENITQGAATEQSTGTAWVQTRHFGVDVSQHLHSQMRMSHEVWNQKKYWCCMGAN